MADSAFKFRLDPIRRLRQAERDELRGRLADAYRAADLLREQSGRVAGEIAELRERQTDAAGQRALNVALLLEAQRYEMVLRGQQAALAGKIKLVEQEIERRREAVAAAERGVKTFDKLEEKQADAHRREAERSELKLLDEAASVAHASRAAQQVGRNA